jgi:hypothetical protein
MGKFLEAVKSLLIDQIALLDPSFDAAGGADAGKSLLMINDQ